MRLHPDHAKGLGIGLWITKSIPVAHGGKADAHSPGQGSTFTLRWRAMPEQASMTDAVKPPSY